MIIRKPTKIELKVENDMQDYENFREKLAEKMRNQRGGLGRRDDVLFGGIIGTDRFKNKSYLFDSNNISESSKFGLSDFMTPQGQADMRRNLYQPSGGMTPEDEDIEHEPNTRFLSALLSGMARDHDSSGRDDN